MKGIARIAVADGDAAQSGAIGASEETWMEATVIGPGYLTFRYKLESGSDTSFSLRLDGGGSTGGAPAFAPSGKVAEI